MNRALFKRSRLQSKTARNKPDLWLYCDQVRFARGLFPGAQIVLQAIGEEWKWDLLHIEESLRVNHVHLSIACRNVH